ncbi:MAG: chromosomal replication initiator protein DnaA [Clostridiales Family XIII bacterium]|jgi:chromosomal replication initiator protein|nr:chromosomal replication initiator protein DnaA [Clostridiales Family XIII bacterium]
MKASEKASAQNWEKVKQKLREFLDEDIRYETWFADLECLRYDKLSETLYVGVKESFKKSSLENRYADMILTNTKEIFDGVESIKFLLPEEADMLFGNGKLSDDEDIRYDNMLNPRYNFRTFIEGENNRFAYGAAKAVAEAAINPKESMNPLFIYGASGLGKTHLMHAIGNYVYEKYPKLKVMYVSSEMFTQDFINASMNKTMKSFKTKYRNVDILMIDDIQFIVEKEKTVEEVFNTYNTLYGMNKQLVFSSDRPPKELLGFDERLLSRLSSGLIVDLKPPAFEIKVAILRNKAKLDNIELSEGLLEVIDVIAEKIKSNIREMEGAFNRVVVYSTLSGNPINKMLARQVLSDVFSSTDVKPTADAIKKKVARYYNIKVSDLDSSNRARQFSFPRQIAMYLCREMTDLSLPQTGNAFGGRDHTTVLHACDKINKMIIADENMEYIIGELKDLVMNI